MEKLMNFVFGRDAGSRVDAAIKSAPAPRIPGPPPTQIAVKDVKADVPEFKREYTARLDHRAVIKIEARSWSYGSGRRYAGDLTQPNGNTIWFDPERIADKIIDPVLVPLVKKAWAEILEMDRSFTASRPDRFTDEKGQVWVRA